MQKMKTRLDALEIQMNKARRNIDRQRAAGVGTIFVMTEKYVMDNLGDLIAKVRREQNQIVGNDGGRRRRLRRMQNSQRTSSAESTGRKSSQQLMATPGSSRRQRVSRVVRDSDDEETEIDTSSVASTSSASSDENSTSNASYVDVGTENDDDGLDTRLVASSSSGSSDDVPPTRVPHQARNRNRNVVMDTDDEEAALTTTSVAGPAQLPRPRRKKRTSSRTPSWASSGQKRKKRKTQHRLKIERDASVSENTDSISSNTPAVVTNRPVLRSQRATNLPTMYEDDDQRAPPPRDFTYDERSDTTGRAASTTDGSVDDDDMETDQEWHEPSTAVVDWAHLGTSYHGNEGVPHEIPSWNGPADHTPVGGRPPSQQSVIDYPASAGSVHRNSDLLPSAQSPIDYDDLSNMDDEELERLQAEFSQSLVPAKKKFDPTTLDLPQTKKRTKNLLKLMEERNEEMSNINNTELKYKSGSMSLDKWAKETRKLTLSCLALDEKILDSEITRRKHTEMFWGEADPVATMRRDAAQYRLEQLNRLLNNFRQLATAKKDAVRLGTDKAMALFARQTEKTIKRSERLHDEIMAIPDVSETVGPVVPLHEYPSIPMHWSHRRKDQPLEEPYADSNRYWDVEMTEADKEANRRYAIERHELYLHELADDLLQTASFVDGLDQATLEFDVADSLENFEKLSLRKPPEKPT